ncbi:cytochrome c-type biogenesis protein CcmH [Povalibacter uvarum]|uniref:Cytochrome c-type biogenesis protein CcmH n=1 Tax=Povalibacter uvarum TaxID=732238 RepID=A0A841HJ26_9GAMM|nr:tetratricopeptide repeat protein [Povalibacter uvarum]MBB6092162.1 cytochrome c-type biogenesis protein CcmH [Povalibacter uvarum]
MTAFYIVCGILLLAVLVWVTLPLWRPQPAVDKVATQRERRVSSAIVVLAVAGLATAMYGHLSNWDWNAVETAAQESANVDEMLGRLEAKLAANPEDVQGWLLLGRSYTTLQRFGRAVDAYQQAYTLTNGENIEAVIGLGEALALMDQGSLSGRAGELIDAALRKAPNNPKALWYGSIAALQAGDLKLGRDRLQALLAQTPPPELRTVLERQIQALNEQMGAPAEGGSSASAAAPVADHARVIRVAVSIAPSVQQQLKGSTPLFIVARDPEAGGPPLAVERHSSTAVPLTVELSEADAMMPTRTIATVPRVRVVARLSLSGAPQERSGDFYGEADYDFSKDTGTLQIVIDRTVP